MMKYKPKNRFINDLHDVLEPVLTGRPANQKPQPKQPARFNAPKNAANNNSGQKNFKWQEHNQQRFHSNQPTAQNKSANNLRPVKNISRQADDWSSLPDEPTHLAPNRPAANAGLTPYQAKQKMRQQQTAYQQQQVRASLAKQNFAPTANAPLPVGMTQNIRHKLHYQPINQAKPQPEKSMTPKIFDKNKNG